MITDTKGFTVVELLVAITLMSIVGVLSSQVFLGFQRNRIQWQERVLLEQCGRRVLNAMIFDLQSLRTLLDSEENSIKLIDSKRKLIRYLLHENVIRRNGRSVLPAGIDAKMLKFSYYSSQGRELNMILSDKASIARIRVTLILRNQKQKRFELTSAAMLRNRQMLR